MNLQGKLALAAVTVLGLSHRAVAQELANRSHVPAAGQPRTTEWQAGNAVDVLGHPLQPVIRLNEPKLLLYVNQGTRSIVSDTGAAIASHLKGLAYITVVHVDLRGVPAFLLGIARKVMAGTETKANRQTEELAQAAGLKPPGEEQLHVVMEPDGVAHRNVGLASGFEHALAVVLDRAGREVLRAPFPEGAATIESALELSAKDAPLATR